MFCLTDQDCDSKWTKIKTSLRSHQQSPPFSKVGAAQRTLRSGLTFDIGGKTLNIITSGQQTLNGVKMKGQKAIKTGKTQEKNWSYLFVVLNLRLKNSCEFRRLWWDGRHQLQTLAGVTADIARHCQTLPTRALVWVITLVSGLAPHCSGVTPDIASFGSEHTNTNTLLLRLRLLFPYQHNWFTL